MIRQVIGTSSLLLLALPVSHARASSPTIPMISGQSFPDVPRLPRGRWISEGQAELSDQETNNNPRARQDQIDAAEAELYEMQNQLLQDFAFSWTSTADNAPVDDAARQHVSYVDNFAQNLASGRYDILPQDRLDDFLGSLRQHYDGRSEPNWIERQITFAKNTRGVGAGDRIYNELLILQVMLHGAVTLFPENQQYADAMAQVETAMAEYGGSRAGARQTVEAAALAEAASVRMPPATQRSSEVDGLFRRAWATSGIPYTIRRIHIRSGWVPKRNALGVVIGQTRDAAIAVEDPATGHCYLYDFTMIREGSSVRRQSHSAKRMACENIPG